MSDPSPSRREFVVRALAALAGCALGVGAAAQKPAVLRVTTIPDEAAAELAREFAPLGAWLGERLGMQMQWLSVGTYAGVVDTLLAGKVDLAWLDGLTFVQSASRSGGKTIPLVQREEDAVFQSVFITRVDRRIGKLEDLVGKTLAFGSPSSNAGHLMPRSFMLAAKVDPQRDLKAIVYTGTAEATLQAVVSGQADAGALGSLLWRKFVEDRRVDPGEVQVFYTTPPYYNGNWTVRADMDEALRKRITQAFLSLDRTQPRDARILRLQRASKYIPTAAGNYSAIQAAAEAAGLLK